MRCAFALLCLLVLLNFAAPSDALRPTRGGFSRKLLQTSEESTTSESTESNEGISSESSEEEEEITLGSGVYETYRNWDGASSPGILGSGSIFSWLGSILGTIVLVAIIVAVIALIAFGVVFLVKKKNAAAKAPSGSAEYVLMENDVPLE